MHQQVCHRTRPVYVQGTSHDYPGIYIVRVHTGTHAAGKDYHQEQDYSILLQEHPVMNQACVWINSRC